MSDLEKDIGEVKADIRTLTIEVSELRQKYKHDLSNEVNVIKCKVEIFENNLKELVDLRTVVAVMDKKVTDFIDNTDEYRKHLCTKVDNLRDRIYLLPCEVREEKSKGLAVVISLLWGAIIMTFGILIAHLKWK